MVTKPIIPSSPFIFNMNESTPKNPISLIFSSGGLVDFSDQTQ